MICQLGSLLWEKKVVDIVQPDVMYMGGLYRTLEVASMANEIGLPCTPMLQIYL